MKLELPKVGQVWQHLPKKPGDYTGILWKVIKLSDSFIEYKYSSLDYFSNGIDNKYNIYNLMLKNYRKVK